MECGDVPGESIHDAFAMPERPEHHVGSRVTQLRGPFEHHHVVGVGAEPLVDRAWSPPLRVVRGRGDGVLEGEREQDGNHDPPSEPRSPRQTFLNRPQPERREQRQSHQRQHREPRGDPDHVEGEQHRIEVDVRPGPTSRRATWMTGPSASTAKTAVRRRSRRTQSPSVSWEDRPFSLALQPRMTRRTSPTTSAAYRSSRARGRTIRGPSQ